jgi:hypothetical protein
MTKRNKKNIKVLPLIPLIIKCNCGEVAIEGSIGCVRYPECCDEDLEFID